MANVTGKPNAEHYYSRLRKLGVNVDKIREYDLSIGELEALTLALEGLMRKHKGQPQAN